jgi:hypothetical protein
MVYLFLSLQCTCHVLRLQISLVQTFTTFGDIWRQMLLCFLSAGLLEVLLIEIFRCYATRSSTWHSLALAGEQRGRAGWIRLPAHNSSLTMVGADSWSRSIPAVSQIATEDCVGGISVCGGPSFHLTSEFALSFSRRLPMRRENQGRASTHHAIML